MADDVTLNPGSGGDTIAADEIVGVKHQRVKVQYGDDGSATDVSDTNPLPIDDAGGSITVDNGGAFPVQEDGAALTALQLIDNIVHSEDAAHQSGDAGVLALAVRRDTAASSASLDGDYATVNVDASGRVWVHDPVSVALLTTIDSDTGSIASSASATETNTGNSATSLAVIDDWDESDRAKVNPIAGQAGVQGGAGASTALTQRVAIATDANAVDTELPAAAALADNAANPTAPAVGAFAMCYDGATWDRVPGDATNGLTVNLGANNDVTVTGSVTATGSAAHDAAISGNPTRIGARAQTSDFTAVSTGDTVDFLATILGKQVVIPHALPSNFWRYAAASGGITNTTGVTAKAAAGTNIINYITHVSVVNGGAADTDVQIRDGASGTVMWRSFAKAGGGGISETLNPPLRGTANTLVEVACGTTGSATYFNLQGYIAAE